jgi:NADH-quinone oxidoreductase subunit G
MRTRSCPNKDVNDIWLCDKGWFGYEYSYHPERLQTPLIRKNGRLEPSNWEEALTLVAKKIMQAKPRGKLAAFGGNPLTTEENYLFQKLMRDCAGVDHVDHRIGMPLFSLDEVGVFPGMETSFGECEELSYAILLGLDVTEEFPVLWLRLKQAMNRGAVIHFLGHYAPEVSQQLHKVILHSPEEELDQLRQYSPSIAALAEGGKRGAIFVGRQYLANPLRKAILSELLALRVDVPNLSLNIMEGRGNSMGATLAGMHPELGPLAQKSSNPGMNIVQVLEAGAKSGWDVLYVAGGNPVLKYPNKLWMEMRKNLGFLVVQDLFLTETAEQADVVLPALSAIEKSGRFHNIEGRAQQLLPGKSVPEGLYADAEIFIALAQKMGISLSIDPEFSKSLKEDRLSVLDWEIRETLLPAKESHKQGALLATFAPSLFDNGVRMNHDPHTSRLVKEPRVKLNPIEGSKRGISDGKSVQLKVNGNSIYAKVKLDPSIAEGTIMIPLGFKKIPVNELGVNLLNGIDIEVSQET